MPLVTSLPTASLPATKVNPRILLIYGPPKVGKSSIIPKLDGSYLHIDTENGLVYIDSCKVSVNNKVEYEQVLALTRKPDAPKYKYLIIDTIDEVEVWSEMIATARYKTTPVGKNFEGTNVLQLPNGAGYLWLRMAFKELFTMAQQCTENLILIGHIRDRSQVAGEKILSQDGTFKAVSNEAVSFRDLDLTGKVRSIVCSQADAIGHLYRDTQSKLFINFATNEGVTCGSRCKHLIGANFEFDWKKIYLDGK